MRAIVVGGDSKLGRALCDRLLERGYDVVWTTRKKITGASDDRAVHLDLRNPVLPPSVLEDTGDRHYPPIYLMAAITGIAPASSHPDAWRVNAEAPVALATQARHYGWHPVFMSSGAVERAQETASARQKSYADLAVLMLGGCVLRPLPVVPPEKYGEIADLLVAIGEVQRRGLVRWEG